MVRIKGSRKVHRYSNEFKLRAVKLSQIEAASLVLGAAVEWAPYSVCEE
jgi:transposase-like protein